MSSDTQRTVSYPPCPECGNAKLHRVGCSVGRLERDIAAMTARAEAAEGILAEQERLLFGVGTISPLPDNRDAEIAALKAELAKSQNEVTMKVEAIHLSLSEISALKSRVQFLKEALQGHCPECPFPGENAALKAENERMRSDIEAERVRYAMNLRIRAFLAEVGK